MKGFIPDDKIEEIKTRADIADLISEYVTLKRAGKNFLGLCPFHKEKTPSFTVNRDKQMFYCFGCGEGGHVFSFLMKMNNMTFPEAARYLAKKSGIVIPEETATAQQRMQRDVREQFNRINEAAAVCFARSLPSPAGAGAREYLKKRGIRDEVVREFRLGYADDGWRTMRNFFQQQQIPLALVHQAGLIIAKGEDTGDFYDRFRGRLMFPIEDVAGRVIAFGGRIIGSGEPKYLNSPETPTYSKGKNLYGLKRAMEHIRESGYAILVEGYFDLISLWNAGMRNVVASLGTALTREQVDLLRRYTGQVAILFDPDEAGRKALERSLQLFLAGSVQARAVVLPEAYDPDDYVRKFGKENLEDIIAHAPSLVDYYIAYIVGKRTTLEEKREAAKEALSFVSTLDDVIARNLFLKRIAEKLGIDEEVLKKEAQRKQSPSPPIVVKAHGMGGPDFDRVEFRLILLMIEHSESIAQVQETNVLDYFTTPALKDLGEQIIAFFNEHDGGALEPSFFLDRVENGPLKGQILQSLVEAKDDDGTAMARYLSDAIGKIRGKWFQRKMKMIQKELEQAQEKGNDDLCRRLVVEKGRLREEAKLI